jgi:hypothetical protein
MILLKDADANAKRTTSKSTRLDMFNGRDANSLNRKSLHLTCGFFGEYFIRRDEAIHVTGYVS